ncbi:UNVERIFIED_CONTAM: hypothetical protein FKN15_033887 [Acipenser sinensis]
MQPSRSYIVGGQRISGQLTGKPAGTRPDYRGHWCHPLGSPIQGRQWNSLDLNRRSPGYAHPALHVECLYRIHHSGAPIGYFFYVPVLFCFAMWLTMQGTIYPAQDFNPGMDAEMLYGAIQGMGCDKDVLIDILTQRSNAQRLMIAEAYREVYGRGVRAQGYADPVMAAQDAMVTTRTF